MDERGAALAARFREAFGAEPRLYRAPGRVNLIGEHTDYNDGLVLPAALELATWVAAAPRSDRRLRFRSLTTGAVAEAGLDGPAAPRHDWTDYVVGTALMLERSGTRLAGADLLIASDVPLGAGLSSSAALEVAVGYALLDLAGSAVDRTRLARDCQRAENEFVGMRCGIMDQFTACHGAAGHALLIDCRSLEWRRLPLEAPVRLVICNSMVRHELAASEYNLRRQECERAVALLAHQLPAIRALRDVSMAALERHAAALPDAIVRRARHVIGENARVLAAAAALERRDLGQFGALMTESHASLRDDFAVSCPELDLLVELAGRVAGVFGARMTGGGFGGCTVNLVEVGAVERFRSSVADDYRAATGLTPDIFVCSPGEGAARVVAAPR